ncbi:MAG: restriction endonuclease subunit S [Gammaproteobacteria bacterium]|nr:restriction endonuclease subunit S [Gammaproteobacteria bacterium]
MTPEGWVHTKLGKVAATVTSGSRDWAQYYSDSGAKFIRMTNLRRDGIDLNLDDLKFVDVKSDSADGKRTQLKHGDILISITAELGKIGWIPNNLGEAYINQHTALVRLKKKHSDSKFIAYLLSSKKMHNSINRLNDAGAKAGLNLQTIKSIPIVLPPIGEQAKIANILSTWDKAIEIVEKLIDNSRAQKKALMQQLLSGKKRLPGFNDKWEYKKISQIAKRIQRKSDSQEHPILTISSLTGFVTQEERYSRYMAGESVNNYILLKNGEFAYNKGNSKTYQFGCVFDLETFKTGLVPHVYVCFKLNKELSHRFYKYLFEADYLKPQLGRLVNTGVRNNGLLNIKPSEFMGTKVPVPSYEEQEKIADLLHTANQNISNLRTQLDLLKEEKRALMQQLLTGKRRVKVEAAA